ncbi:hypothetical protein CFI10_04075 [Marinobacterium iners]|uniref:hypothetical protein n=1 Tax=Marinobacterium iners TaxID=48076 RepID=UPI001A8CC793|nr:hypothetical protein [Marinobacterium iners]QSR34171.1 hypothetical protein CFI10_04075 [Marinobacterium iners]
MAQEPKDSYNCTGNSGSLSHLINRLGLLPNVKTPTMGGEFWWNDLASCDGWRVQRNSVTGHCRILDPNNVRQAWGGQAQIMALFQMLLKGQY